MNASERAAQIWPVLMFAAYHRQTIDHRTLSRLIGVSPADLWPLLVPVRRYCLDRGTPDLTRIVVGTVGEEPALSEADLEAALVAVFHHAWLDETAPTAADFEPFGSGG